MTSTSTASLPHGVDLAFALDGPAGAPVVMPILGITDNLTDWDDALTRPFLDAGFRVLRHELRDSGHSTHFDAEGFPDVAAGFATLAAGTLPDASYTMHDVAADARALLDHLDIARVHAIGYSYGGAVAQILAFESPERVASLTCLQSSNYAPGLPSRTDAVGAAMANACRPWSTVEERVEAMTALRLATNGTRHAMTPEEARASAAASVTRAYVPDGTARIVLSRLATPDFTARTRKIAAPTLVLHGNEDPIFAIAHGEAIAAAVPAALLEVLDGAGHNHPTSLKPILTSAIAGFIARHA